MSLLSYLRPAQPARDPRQWCGSLWHRQEGVAALEFAFLLPVFLLMLTGVIQFGAIFFVQNNMASVAQDTSRRVAVGELTATEGRTYAEGALLNWGVVFTVAVTEPGTDVLVDISAPLAEAALIDLHGFFDGGTLRAQATARQE